jgi:hypothetical protein
MTPRRWGGRYILDADHNLIPCLDLMTWARWYEDAPERWVARTALPNGHVVSTIFLGLDHNFFGEGPPVVFESMVFPTCDHLTRYCTWAEAEAGHLAMVELAAGLPQVPPPEDV